jgi:hypothetical protein
MKKILFTMLMLGVVTAIPVVTSAATYQYVDTNGNLATVTADNAAQAMTVANLGPHSGVMLVTGSPVVTNNFPITTNGGTYLYVDIYGNLKTVVASSPAQALTLATNITTHSGVMLVR